MGSPSTGMNRVRISCKQAEYRADIRARAAERRQIEEATPLATMPASRASRPIVPPPGDEHGLTVAGMEPIGHPTFNRLFMGIMSCV
jgi:hypothetical protein